MITMVVSLGGENAYWDSGPNGHASSLMRNEPLSSSPMPSTVAAMRQAYDDRLMPRTRCPTGDYSTIRTACTAELSFDLPPEI